MYMITATWSKILVEVVKNSKDSAAYLQKAITYETM